MARPHRSIQLYKAMIFRKFTMFEKLHVHMDLLIIHNYMNTNMQSIQLNTPCNDIIKTFIGPTQVNTLKHVLYFKRCYKCFNCILTYTYIMRFKVLENDSFPAISLVRISWDALLPCWNIDTIEYRYTHARFSVI